MLSHHSANSLLETKHLQTNLKLSHALINDFVSEVQLWFHCCCFKAIPSKSKATQWHSRGPKTAEKCFFLFWSQKFVHLFDEISMRLQMKNWGNLYLCRPTLVSDSPEQAWTCPTTSKTTCLKILWLKTWQSSKYRQGKPSALPSIRVHYQFW